MVQFDIVISIEWSKWHSDRLDIDWLCHEHDLSRQNVAEKLTQ